MASGLKAKRRRCGHESGCQKFAKQGGVCIAHGAKVQRCQHPSGCPKHPVQGGLCIAHGAKRKRTLCRHESGCTKLVQQGGRCIAHGARAKKRRRCQHESGCVKNAVQGGLCIAHGAKVKKCKHGSGCGKVIKQGGRCIAHGASMKRCEHPGGCLKYVIRGGLCVNHGARTQKRKRCEHQSGCSKSAVAGGGMCILHGPKRKKMQRCEHASGCRKIARQGRLCLAHGGTAERCEHESGCMKFAKEDGFCAAHGALVKQAMQESGSLAGDCKYSAQGASVHPRHHGSASMKPVQQRGLNVYQETHVNVDERNGPGLAQQAGAYVPRRMPVRCQDESGCLEQPVEGAFCATHASEVNKKRNAQPMRPMCVVQGEFRHQLPTHVQHPQHALLHAQNPVLYQQQNPPTIHIVSQPTPVWQVPGGAPVTLVPRYPTQPQTAVVYNVFPVPNSYLYVNGR